MPEYLVNVGITIRPEGHEFGPTLTSGHESYILDEANAADARRTIEIGLEQIGLRTLDRHHHAKAD